MQKLLLACLTIAAAPALEAQEPARADSAGRVSRPVKKDDHTLPVGKTQPADEQSFRIGGYAKLDVIQDLAGSIGNQYQFKVSTIAVDGTPAADQEGWASLNARESRVNADLRLKGHMRAFVEGDFFGDGGAFRLRHAYGEVGHLLAGQTWTTFMDIEARPLTVDFEGPDSEVFIRQALLRWTQPLSPALRAQVAIENPAPELAVPGSLSGSARSRVPDGVATLRVTQDRGHLQVAGVLRQLRFDGEGTSPNLTATGWGLNATLVFRTIGQDQVYGQAMVGEGVAHYVDGRAGQDGDAVIVGSDLRPLPLKAFMVGYTHHWSASTRSGVAYSVSVLDTDASQGGSATRRQEDARANFFFLPHPHVDLALEVLWGRREEASGASGDAWRAQGAVIYHFGWKFTN